MTVNFSSCMTYLDGIRYWDYLRSWYKFYIQFHSICMSKWKTRICGIFFTSRPNNLSGSLMVINKLKLRGFYEIGGVPKFWRTGNGDSNAIIKMFIRLVYYQWNENRTHDENSHQKWWSKKRKKRRNLFKKMLFITININ